MSPQKVMIGLTGSFGTGLHTATEFISKKFGYDVIAFSDILKEEALTKGWPFVTRKEKQEAGDRIRKENRNNFYLAEILTGKIQNKDKVVIRGFRNSSEVKYFRQFPNFTLFAIDSTRENRWDRVKKEYQHNEKVFDEDDKRDHEEDYDWGQQVDKCVYLSDILILNNDTKHQFEAKIEKVMNNFITGDDPRYPQKQEALMTQAYGISLRSECLKRKVGAIIATEDFDIISSGLNDLPGEDLSCKELYGHCYRDEVKADVMNSIKKCPLCGFDYNPASVICSNCKGDLSEKIINKYLIKCRSLHAEEMALLNLLKSGTKYDLSKAILFTTTYPCSLCAKKIIDTGIGSMIYVEPYPDKESRKLFDKAEKEKRIKISQFEGVKSMAYFRFFQRFEKKEEGGK